MTVSTTVNKVSYTASAAQTTFAYIFKIFADGDLKVYVNSTQKTLTTDYTVTGAGDVGGGNIIFGTGLAIDDIVIIERVLLATQGTDYVENDPFPADAHEDALDKLTMLIQQSGAFEDRSVRAPTVDLSPSMELPIADTRATKMLGFDADGDPVMSGSTVTDIDASVAAAFAGGVLASSYQFTGTGSQVAFTITGGVTAIPNAQALIITIDGVTQHTDTYTTAAAVVTFSTAPPLNADIQIRYNAYLGDANDASGITYNQGGTGASSRTVENKLQESVSVKDFGAVSGDTSASVATANLTAFQAAFDTGLPVTIPGEVFSITGKISYAANDVVVDARGATLIFGGTAGATGFAFGSSATDSLPNYTGLNWTGGTFKNVDATENVNRTYFQISGMQHFSIKDVVLEDVSNGGILLRAGCRDGLIENIRITSWSAYTTLRGIWLAGSDATDYASVLVDISSITRNATALPVGGIQNVTIRKCHIVGNYCIYLMNARNTLIEDNYLDKSTMGLRNVTVNTYSPYTTIRNNYFTSSAAGKGILVTQYSHNVLIEGNKFNGDWGTSSVLQLTYLSQTQVVNNDFRTSSPVTIVAEMGANGRVAGNRFDTQEGVAKTAGDRCMRIQTIGTYENATTGYGNTATVLKPWIFENNEIHTKNFGVQLTHHSAFDAPNNEVGIELVTVESNTFYNWDDISNTQEYPLYIESALTPDNPMHYLCHKNIISPPNSTFEGRNRAEDPNGTAINIRATNQLSEFLEFDYSYAGATIADSANDQPASFAAVGVKFGDFVMMSSSSDTGGITTTARVQAADRLKFNLVNETGASITLPAATFTFRVYKK